MRLLVPIYRWIEDKVDPFADYDVRTPDSRPFHYLVDQMRTLGPVLKFAIVSASIVAVLELGLIWYAGRLVDLMTPGPVGFWANHGGEIAAAAVVFLFFRPIVVGLNAIILFCGISTNMLPQVRWRAHRYMLGQSVGFFQNDFAGRLANRVMQTGVAVEDTAFLIFEAFWNAVAFSIVTVLLMTQMSMWLAIPMMLWLALFIGFAAWFAPIAGEVARKHSEGNSRVTGRIVDSYTNIETVKLFAHTSQEEAYARSAIRRHRVRFGAMMRFFATQTGAVGLLNSAALFAVIGPALLLWSHEMLSIGEVAAAIAMALRLNSMTGWIMWMTVRVFEHFGTIKEGLDSLAVPQTVTDVAGAKPLNVTVGEIRFEGVGHHYGRTSGGLNGINLTIKGGERVGLVGPSGAGKSTLVNLLLRLRDAEEGAITIDGQNVVKVQQQTLRKSIGMVTQDTSLMHRSVRDNLLYGRPDATEEQMIAAAKQAEAHDFILTLEDSGGRRGYNALVGERGVKLSGGQRQRVALARVILKDAPILLLDEATSALDSEVEAAIQRALNQMMNGKTVIAIAHRLSTIARMDRIIVMGDGRIIEDGTHDSLLAENGQYARFWARQSGGFLGHDAAQSGT